MWPLPTKCVVIGSNSSHLVLQVDQGELAQVHCPTPSGSGQSRSDPWTDLKSHKIHTYKVEPHLCILDLITKPDYVMIHYHLGDMLVPRELTRAEGMALGQALQVT